MANKVKYIIEFDLSRAIKVIILITENNRVENRTGPNGRTEVATAKPQQHTAEVEAVRPARIPAGLPLACTSVSWLFRRFVFNHDLLEE